MHVFLAVLCFLGGSLGLVSAVVIATQQLRRDGRIRDRFAVAIFAVVGVWLLTSALWHLFDAAGWLRVGTIYTNPIRAVAFAVLTACLIAVIVKSRRNKNPPNGGA